ncbi:MAG: lipopolysaccharide biosynthesis protein [Thomasclavelia spiroformis]|uniref:lipopolysaccharide biosynthesis protein n=1 Tax=Thomasclavelia spiroformis TaxID=29348 RepID=UPI003990C89A
MSKMSLRKASAIYSMAKYMIIIIQLFITAFLSRLLTPDDYGIVAVVTVFTTFFSTLGNLGLGTAVTQYRDLSQENIQDIFTFSEYFSCVLAVIFILLSYPISLFYNNKEYITIIILLSISVFFNSLNMIPEAILRKQQSFFQLGVRMILNTFISGILAMIMAILGCRYYSLVFQSVIFAFIQFFWNYKSTFLKVRLKYHYDSIKKVKNYSSNQFIYNIFNYFAQNLDNLLTAKIMGNEMLAYYNKGYTLMRYPVNNITHAITPVLHPILSEYQYDKKVIYTEFVKVIKLISLVGVFITGFCFWAGKEIIICCFGNQWDGAILPFKWLSICIGVQLMNALFGAIYQSLGCTKQMLKSGMLHISISLFAIIFGSYSKSIVILAICVSISMYLKFLIESYFLIKKSFGFSLTKFFKIFIPDIVILIGLFFIQIFIGDIYISNMWISLIIKMSILLFAFFFITYNFKTSIIYFEDISISI